MKALILNSGMGSRMGVLSAEQPKCMTEVYGNHTIISRQLEQLLEYGITEIVITTGAHETVLRKYVESLSLPLDIKYVYNKDYQKTNYIYSIYCADEYLDDDIILIHGDLVFENRVLEMLLSTDKSCMAVSSSMPLPQKDFKAVINQGRIVKVGVDFFENAVAAQPAYFLLKKDWGFWRKTIREYCESGEEVKRKCYAENAFNEISDKCRIYPLDVDGMLCNEVDTPEDLLGVAKRVQESEDRTVYVSFSTDVLHSGHIALIKKARRLGKLIVGLISDDVVASYKRYPLLPYEERKALFENIVGVHRVVEQKTLSYRTNIENYKPSIVVHGDDWKEGFQKPIRDEVIELLSEYGGELIEFPYANDPKYSLLEKRINSEQKFLYVDNRYDIIDDYLIDNHVRKLFVVCGNAVKYHPLYKFLCENNKSYEVVEFSDFSPNPKYESVCKGVQSFIINKCDSILAIGGGSTIDVAKCIKLFANMDQSINYLEQRIEENIIPLTVIPTTAGTGSEVTRFAVIYYNGVKQSISHESCIPSMVFYDSSFLKTVPDYHRKATMLDALCHGIESYWSVNSTDESKAYSKEAITMILDNKDRYLVNDDQANINMQQASRLAGRAINITQTTAGHAMSYMLTELFGIAHGHAVALCINVIWPYMIDNISNCSDKRGERYLMTSLRELATIFYCDSPVEAYTKFGIILRDLGFEDNARFAVDGIDETIYALAENVKPERMVNHPVFIPKEDLMALYRSVLRPETLKQ